MAISVFDLFKIGIGPSSSHTVGPMRAATRFVQRLEQEGKLGKTHGVHCELFGSLGLTGKGHGSDKAVLLGLEGETPESVDVTTIEERLSAIRDGKKLKLLGRREVAFEEKKQLIFNRTKRLPLHSNGMRFIAFDENRTPIDERVFYSIGGGFVVNSETAGEDKLTRDETQLPHPFKTASDLLENCSRMSKSISSIMMENEKVWRTEEEVHGGLLAIWKVMKECVERGLGTKGELPGGLNVRRRAPRMLEQLEARKTRGGTDPLDVMDWVSLFAIAVNEENAAGGRVVTAPTNGAAGIIPAVMHYYWKFCEEFSEQQIVNYLLTAGAIGILYKENASISGAEVGCQGEVGVACSMAAGALCEVMGGTVGQVENAAEIGMEHNLGLTCDPIGGLVQIPCIERNAMGAIKAINAARMALNGDGSHFVSLDKVIITMRETGADMKTKYKETSRGGLAVNIIEC